MPTFYCNYYFLLGTRGPLTLGAPWTLPTLPTPLLRHYRSGFVRTCVSRSVCRFQFANMRTNSLHVTGTYMQITLHTVSTADRTGQRLVSAQWSVWSLVVYASLSGVCIKSHVRPSAARGGIFRGTSIGVTRYLRGWGGGEVLRGVLGTNPQRGTGTESLRS